MDTKVLTKTGVAFGIGAVGGVLDTIGTEQDAKNIATAVAAGKKQSVLKQYGTYVNYAIPVVEVLLSGFEVVKGDMATVLSAQAGALAGAKVARNFTMAPFGSKKNYTLTFSTSPSAWTRDMPPSKQDRYVDYSNPASIPTTPIIPVVSPPSNLGGRGSLT